VPQPRRASAAQSLNIGLDRPPQLAASFVSGLRHLRGLLDAVVSNLLVQKIRQVTASRWRHRLCVPRRPLNKQTEYLS
jgi:hypothetical protein